MFIHSLIGNSIGGVRGVESRGPQLFFLLFFSPVTQEREPFFGWCGAVRMFTFATIGKIAQHAIVGVRAGGRAGQVP